MSKYQPYHRQPRDTEYHNFVASTVNLDGIEIPAEKTPKVQISPIKIVEKKQSKSAIDEEFWRNLEQIDLEMTKNKQIKVEDGYYICEVCDKDYDSYVQLLKHCWNKHQDVLKE